MFCILLANLRKQVKTPYNLLGVNEDFKDERNDERALLDSFFLSTFGQSNNLTRMRLQTHIQNLNLAFVLVLP